jgi:hypothetical protein
MLPIKKHNEGRIYLGSPFRESAYHGSAPLFLCCVMRQSITAAGPYGRRCSSLLGGKEEEKNRNSDQVLLQSDP